MSKKSMSDALFWLKHLGLAVALIILAVVLIRMQNVNFSTPKPEGAPQERSIKQGLSDFYADYRRGSKPDQEKLDDFVMSVNIDDTPLDQRLDRMQSSRRPVNERWVGEQKYRTFKAGSTLRESIYQYAASEGMQLIWELDQDFIIKHQFQMENTIAGSVAKVASAIDSNFNGQVRGYMCPSQRALVITDKDSQYLTANCTLLTSQPG